MKAKKTSPTRQVISARCVLSIVVVSDCKTHVNNWESRGLLTLKLDSPAGLDMWLVVGVSRLGKKTLIVNRPQGPSIIETHQPVNQRVVN